MRNSKIKYIIAGIFTIALVSLPAILYLSNKQQEIRTKASASTSLYFAPTASSSSPLQVNVGDPVKFDVMINPGTNLPSVVTLDIRFDTSKIQATPTSFMVNSSSFPTTLEGPILTDKSLNVSLSIGTDTTKAIQTTTKVGTITFTAIAPTTNEPTAITFGNTTSVLSIGATDFATENTLSTTSPGLVKIIGDVINHNVLNIKDYNVLLNCYSDFSPAKSCNDTNKVISDLNEDGEVNQIDYNIFLRGISVQSGN